MPDQQLVTEFKSARAQWVAVGQSLASLTASFVMETVIDVLPEAQMIEVRGEFTEDWLRVLRVQRVLSATGEVLFDVAVGHDDRRVEAAIDEVNEEYFDLLLDLTGDAYMGDSVIELDLTVS